MSAKTSLRLCVWYQSCGCVSWSKVGQSAPFSTPGSCPRCGRAVDSVISEVREVESPKLAKVGPASPKITIDMNVRPAQASRFLKVWRSRRPEDGR